MSKTPKENPNAFDRDHDVFPTIVTADGEVLSPEQVAYAYTREGRRLLGKEYPNPVPLEPPLGHVDHVPIHEQIAAMVQRHLAAQAGQDEFESEDEANDFDVGDDYDPSSPYEEVFQPQASWVDTLAQLVREGREIKTEAPADPAGGAGGSEAPPSVKPTSDAPASPGTPTA